MKCLPNILTSMRIGFVPIIVSLFYCDFSMSKYFLCGSFLLACITDYLDGKIARAYKNISKIGAFLDPIADKLLVITTMFMIAGFNIIDKFSLLPAVIIIFREICICGLRGFVKIKKINKTFSFFVKLKTT